MLPLSFSTCLLTTVRTHARSSLCPRASLLGDEHAYATDVDSRDDDRDDDDDDDRGRDSEADADLARRLRKLRALCAVLHDPTMTRARWRPTDVYALVLFRSYIYVYIRRALSSAWPPHSHSLSFSLALSLFFALPFPLPVRTQHVTVARESRAYHDTLRIA